MKGANGVQARTSWPQLAQDGGKHVMAFFDLVKNFYQGTPGRTPNRATTLWKPLKAAKAKTCSLAA